MGKPHPIKVNAPMRTWHIATPPYPRYNSGFLPNVFTVAMLINEARKFTPEIRYVP